MNKKDVILFMSIFCVLALIAGGTYAYWQWESADEDDTYVVFNVMKGIDDYIYYDGGVSKFVGNFQPSADHCGGKGNTIEFYVKSDAPDEMKENEILTATIKMDVNNISDKISSSNYVKWAVTVGSESDCGTVISSGTFNGMASGSTIVLASKNGEENIFITETSSKYTVWVWVDSAAGTTILNDLAGETLDVNIWTQIDMTSVD